jgi:hypothetical protein
MYSLCNYKADKPLVFRSLAGAAPPAESVPNQYFHLVSADVLLFCDFSADKNHPYEPPDTHIVGANIPLKLSFHFRSDHQLQAKHNHLFAVSHKVSALVLVLFLLRAKYSLLLFYLKPKIRFNYTCIRLKKKPSKRHKCTTQ